MRVCVRVHVNVRVCYRKEKTLVVSQKYKGTKCMGFFLCFVLQCMDTAISAVK